MHHVPLSISAAAGFHLYRSELDAMPDPQNAHARRGAAFTFNAPKFVERMRSLAGARNASEGAALKLPSFDHGRGDPVEDDVCVLPGHRLVIVEGIYVLRGACAFFKFAMQAGSITPAAATVASDLDGVDWNSECNSPKLHIACTRTLPQAPR